MIDFFGFLQIVVIACVSITIATAHHHAQAATEYCIVYKQSRSIIIILFCSV